MNSFVCSVQPCDATKYEALGMCRTHYRRSRPRKPDAKVALSCDGCGSIVMKEKRARRYDTVQCSDWLCRQWLTFRTAQSSKLPNDHWAVMYGKTSLWVAPVTKTRSFRSCTCADCGKNFLEPTEQTQSSYCGESCATRVAKRRRRAREHNAQGMFKTSDITRLYREQGNACAYCQLPVDGLPQPEHVLAISRGGEERHHKPCCLLCFLQL